MPIVLTWTRADISKYINLKKERYRQAKGREGNTSFEHHKVVGADRCVIVEQYSIIRPVAATRGLELALK